MTLHIEYNDGSNPFIMIDAGESKKKSNSKNAKTPDF